MKVLGLDLDNSPYIAQDKSLRYAKNITIDNKGQSYFNERGFDFIGELDDILENHPTNRHIIPYIYSDSAYHKYNIIGTIPTNIGVVLFCVVEHWNEEDKSDLQNNDAIIYLDLNDNNPTVKRCLYSTGAFGFSIDRPIHGDYIYNYKENLIVVFTEGTDDSANETRIINLTDPFYDGKNGEDTTIGINVVSDDIDLFNLIPNVTYPELQLEVKDGGNLKTGAYQIAIKYRLDDGTYTNYSPLSTSLIVCGNYEEDYALGIEINKNITISFRNNNIKYKHCKFAIVYITDEAQLSYETDDISISGVSTTHIVSDVSYLSTISLDDIFIKNISYIRDNTLVNFNNRLIRGNVKTLDYSKLDSELKEFTENNLDVQLSWNPSSSYINSTRRYFKSGEVYVLYAGYYDYKGDLVNIHHIPWKDNTYGIESFKIGSSDDTAHMIPYRSEKIETIIGGNWDVYPSVSFTPIDEIKQTLENDEITTSERVRYYTLSVNSNVSSVATSKQKLLPKGKVKLPTCPIPYTNKTSKGGLDPSGYSVQVLEVTNITAVSQIIGIQCNMAIQNTTMLPKDLTLELRAYDVTSIVNQIENESEEEFGNYYEISESLILNTASETPGDSNYVSISNNNILSLAENETKYLLFEFKILQTAEGDIAPDFSWITNIFSPIATWELEYSLSPNINIKANLAGKTDLMNKYISSIVYFFVEHNINNSRIITQGFAMRDTEVNNFGKNQTYKNPFGGNNARFYTFEYLYNKINSIRGKLKPLYFETDVLKFVINEELDDDIRVFNALWNGEDFNGFGESNKYGTLFLDADINNLSIDTSRAAKDVSLEYINANISSQNNIAGDSYYRIEKGFEGFSNGSENGLWARGYIADLINNSETLYSDINNQKLQIASNIINIKGSSDVTTPLVGDTFIGYITLRATAPSPDYRYGDAQAKELDSNATVYRWIFTVPLESKFNILARFSINNVDKSFKYHGKRGNELREFYQLSYQVDNFINSSVGKGYSPIYNENGIETFTYFEEIPGTQDHPYRIIRSQLQSAENANLNWRLFRSDDYKDMPFNRGEIIALKTDNKNLYIQQTYGLHLLQLRDTLSNTDEGTSYLGTADIFNMEPQEVTYSPSGYIGCQSYFDTHVNVIGYFVIDAVHRRIFNINGDKVSNMTALNALKWFDGNLVKDVVNPFKNNGRIWAFNEDTNILYLVQNVNNRQFTISFSPVANAWISFHDYNPIVGITNRNGLFWFDKHGIYAISKNNYGRFLKDDNNNQLVKESYIKFILNDNSNYNKLLNNIAWKDRVDIVNNLLPTVNEFYKTINEILVHNDDQCTGYRIVKFNDKWYNGTTGVNKVNLWRFNNVNDIHKQIPFMITDLVVDESALKRKAKWYDVNKFICQYVYCIMKFNNSDNNRLWELIDVNPEWILDNRNNQR